MTRYILTVGTGSATQWVRVIPGQIILLKKVNIHVYSIEVGYLSLMSIVNLLYARVYWPFQGGVSFVDPFLLFMFHVSLCYAILCVPCGLAVTFLGGMGLVSWLSRVWCFLVLFVAFPCGVPGLVYQFLILVFFFTLNNKLFV